MGSVVVPDPNDLQLQPEEIQPNNAIKGSLTEVHP